SSFLTAPPPTQTYTLSLHDALPISHRRVQPPLPDPDDAVEGRYRQQQQRQPEQALQIVLRQGPVDQVAHHQRVEQAQAGGRQDRSEEHTSELQSRFDLVCRLLLEKK